MKWFMNWLGDIQNIGRCDNCGNTCWNHWQYAYISYSSHATFHCNRCPKPAGPGRLYRNGADQGSLLPANDEAFNYEVSRAGQPGAIYARRS